MSDFLAMGGYAAFVWPAYGVAAVVLVGLLAVSLRGLKAHETTLKALEGSRPRRSRRTDAHTTAAHNTAAAEAATE